MSAHYHVEPPPIRADGQPGPDAEVPLWRRTLRFEDAPDVLDAEEAAILSRLGATAYPIYELVKSQQIQRAHGQPVPNPLRVIRCGKRILIPKSALQEWLQQQSWLDTERVSP